MALSDLVDRWSTRLSPLFNRLPSRVQSSLLGAGVAFLLPPITLKRLVWPGREAGPGTTQKAADFGGLLLGLFVLALQGLCVLFLAPWLGLVAIPATLAGTVFAGGVIGFLTPED